MQGHLSRYASSALFSYFCFKDNIYEQRLFCCVSQKRDAGVSDHIILPHALLPSPKNNTYFRTLKYQDERL